jgi:5-methylcytosine-specific restriction endonuclease McrA
MGFIDRLRKSRDRALGAALDRLVNDREPWRPSEELFYVRLVFAFRETKIVGGLRGREEVVIDLPQGTRLRAKEHPNRVASHYVITCFTSSGQELRIPAWRLSPASKPFTPEQEARFAKEREEASKRQAERWATSQRANSPSAARPPRRQAIPQHVRHEVWRRDQGQCVDCGSRERLEYDHIIPVSKGGSNTSRNIALRCESCNRRKGARV